MLRKPKQTFWPNQYIRIFLYVYFPVNKVWVCVWGGGGRETPNLSPNQREANESNKETPTSQTGKNRRGWKWTVLARPCPSGWQVCKKVWPFKMESHLSASITTEMLIPCAQRFCL